MAHFELVLSPRDLRPQLLSFLKILPDDIDARTIRTVRVALGQLLAQWLALEPWAHHADTALLEVALSEASVRVDASANPQKPQHEFWIALITPGVEELVDDWGVDRRRSSGVWFEVERPRAGTL